MESKDSRMKVSVGAIASIIVVVALASTAFLVLNNGLGTASDAQEPVPTSDYVLVTSLSSSMVSGAYKLDSDVEVSSVITIGNGVEVWIDLNGHNIVSTADTNVFTVGSGGQLVIKDSALASNDYRKAHMVIDGESVDSANKGEETAQSQFLLSKTYHATDGKVVVNGVTMTLVDNSVTVDGTIITFDGSGNGSFSKLYDVTDGVAIVNGIRTAVYYGKITHSDTAHGRGIVNNGTLWVSGGAIVGNYNVAEVKGAAIYSEGNLYVVSGSLSLNTNANGDGGGINAQKGSLEIRGGSITYNKTVNKGSGGGIMSQINVAVSNAGINNNSCAHNGGGLYVPAAKTATLNSLQVCCNSSGTSGSYGQGGGIFLGKSTTMVDCIVDYNKARIDGGGVFVRSHDSYREPTLTISSTSSGESSISHNVSGGQGGGICAGDPNKGSYSGNVYISGTCSIEYNVAVNGGGVRAFGGVTITNDSTVSISHNSATELGGGLWVGNTSSQGTSSLVSCEISHNVASNGAGIYSKCETITISATLDSNGNRGAYILATNVTVDSADVRNNTFNSSAVNSNDSGNGGGMYIDATNVVVTNTLFENNSAPGPGGGLYLLYAPLSALDNVRFISNTSGSNGGGLMVSSSRDGSVLNLVGCTFTSNTSGNRGGGLYAGSGVVMASSNVSSNTSASGGGGIYSGGDVTMSSETVVASNTATTGNGGGIFSSGKFTLSDGTIRGNSALAGSGGGVYCASAELNGGVIGGDYKDGKKDKDGNSIDYLYYVFDGSSYVLMDPDYSIYSKTFTYSTYLLIVGQGNTCRDSGAGIYASGNVVLDGAAIRGNAATGTSTGNTFGGGGVYCGSMTFTKGKVAGNQHIRQGGGIYCTGTLQMGNNLSAGNNAVVRENISFDGGGIHCKGFTDIHNVYIQANLATIGGGIYLADGGTTFCINSAMIEYNRSVTFAGGVFLNGEMELKGGSISYNRASSGGAGVTDYSTTKYILIEGGTISNNAVTGRFYYTDGEGKSVEDRNYRGILGGAGVYSKVGVMATGGTISDNSIAADIYVEGADITGLYGTFIRIEDNGSAYIARDIADPSTISYKGGHIKVDMYYLGAVVDGSYVGGYHSYMILPSGYATTKTFNEVIKYEILSPLSEGSTWVDRNPDDPSKVVVAGPETCLIGSIRAIYSDLTVKFDFNNGSGEYVYGQFTFEGENAYVNVTQVSPTYEGHLFLGWEYVNVDEENDHCAQGAKVSNAPVKSITFTAKWGDPDYTATLIV